MTRAILLCLVVALFGGCGDILPSDVGLVWRYRKIVECYTGYLAFVHSTNGSSITIECRKPEWKQ